jgi:60 kDa SS-A/Ro ribonucleoprotein
MGLQFNETQDSVTERTCTTNHEGGEAFEPDSAELALTKVVINNLLEDTFYEDAEDQLASVETEFDACADENPEFVLKLAKYARQEENLRQVPQVLLVLAANDERTQPFVRDYARSIMSRADEPLQVLAFHVARHGTTLPNCLQKSIEDALHTYNEYQFAKWDQPNREWQYRDLLNLVHPNPRDEQRDRIFEKIALGDLDDYDVESLTQQDTWESNLSADDGRSKAESYRDSLENMGLFPRIRQARDMLEAGVTADEIYGEVTDEWIRNSRLYPFRFYQAYKAIQGCGIISDERDGGYGGISGGLLSTEPIFEPDIPEAERQEALDFLEHAMEVSTENLPDVLEDTFVAVDTSGSMTTSVSEESNLDCMEIASLFGALVYDRGADLAAFASDIEEYHGDRRDSIPTNMKEIQSMPVGGGTSGYLVPRALREYDRNSYNQVIIFTDMQMWGGSFNDQWERYVEEVNPEASLYLVDLNSYGDLVTPDGTHNVYNLSGWTENVIDFIDKMEHAGEMVDEIEAVEADR